MIVRVKKKQDFFKTQRKALFKPLNQSFTARTRNWDEWHTWKYIFNSYTLFL